MKRKDILQKLAEAGLIFKEGGNHTKVYSKEGKFLSVISRQNEINELREIGRASCRERVLRLV